MDHRQLEESVAGYALGALVDADRHEVEALLLEHLPGCDTCRRMLADFREVAGDLALAAGSRSVPDSIEQRILERIRGEQPAATAVTPVRPRWRVRAAIAATAAAIAGLGAWNLQLASRLTDARTDTDSVARALTLIGSPDAETVRLTGTEQGTLLFVRTASGSVLVGRDLEAPPDGYVLQLWLMRAGVPSSAGVFRPDDGVAVLEFGGVSPDYDAVAVTVEKAPRAVRPSRAPVFSATLTA